MPELPEVENTVRYLRERIVGDSIVDVTVNWARSIDRPSVRKFRQSVIGSRVTDVQRRGKFIIVVLDGKPDPSFLLGHLRMSGSIDVIRKSSPRSKHDRVVLVFDSGKELRFYDPRKFGRFYLVRNTAEVTGKLGPDDAGVFLPAAQIKKAGFEVPSIRSNSSCWSWKYLC